MPRERRQPGKKQGEGFRQAVTQNCDKAHTESSAGFVIIDMKLKFIFNFFIGFL
jgi:hypothetical protein